MFMAWNQSGLVIKLPFLILSTLFISEWILILLVCSNTSSYMTETLSSFLCYILQQSEHMTLLWTWKEKKLIMIYSSRLETVISCSLGCAFLSHKSKQEIRSFSFFFAASILIILLFSFKDKTAGIEKQMWHLVKKRPLIKLFFMFLKHQTCWFSLGILQFLQF